MVIGVVAALTIPTLQQGIGDAILNRQKKVFANKLEEGLHRMAVQDKLGTKYKNTNAFIKEFKNFFSVTMTCDSNNLKNCFNETITNSDGDVFEVENLKSAKDFNSENNDAAVYGIKFTDGTSMLLAYEPNCRGYSSSDIPKDANVGAFAKCFKYIYDVNGTKEENKVGVDMIGTLSPVKSGSFGLPFTIIGNKAFRPGETYEGKTYTCANATQATGNENGYYNCDNWLGAKRFCESIGGSLPTDENHLQEIAKQLYNCSIDYIKRFKCSPDTSNPLWAAITNGNSSAGLWSDEVRNNMNTSYRYFQYNASGYDNTEYRSSNKSVICIK